MISNRKGSAEVTVTVAVVAAVILLVTVFTGFFTVQPGQSAVLVTLGKASESTYGEGVHWKTPWVSSSYVFTLGAQNAQVDASAASKDLQTVSAKLAVNWSLQASAVTETYRRYGDLNGLDQKLVRPAIQEAFKATTAGYTAEQLITQREKVSQEALAGIRERVTSAGVTVNAFSVLDFDFSPDFNAAIERKVKAEQDALTEKNKLETIKYQAQQAVATAQGAADATLATAKAEAEAIRIKSQAVTAQGGADYVKLKWIEKWDGSLPKTTFGANAVPMVDFRDEK